MKNWILNHKKLYYFIVGLIAFILFIAITLHGVKRASAATEVTYNDYGEMRTGTVYDLRELSWDYWLNNTQPDVLAWYDNPENLANDIISECNYWVVIGGDYYFFFKEPFYHDGSLSVQSNIFLNYDNGYVVTVQTIDGIPSVVDVYGSYDNHSNADSSRKVMYNGGSNVIGSSYDFLVNCTDTRKDGITRNNLSYPTVEPDILHGLERHVENVVFTEIVTDGVAKWQVTYDSIPELQYPLPNTYSLYSAHRFRVPPLTYLQFLKGEEILESDVSEWRESRTYFEEYEFTLETSYSGVLDLYEASRSALVSQWFDIYGVELDSELLDIALRYAYPHVSIFRPLEIVDGVLYGGNSNICYAQSIYMGYDDNLEIVLYEDISGHGFDSILDMAADSLYEDSDELKTQLENALIELEETKVALAETQKKLEEAREELEAALKTDLSSFLNFFSDIAQSFEAATEAVGAIGRGIGKVFSFLPTEIRVGLYFALPFLVFVAIYKALKS